MSDNRQFCLLSGNKKPAQGGFHIAILIKN